MKKKLGLLSVLTVMAAVLVCGCVSSKDASFKVGNDTVPSLYSVVGERKLNGQESGTDNGVTSLKLTYKGGDVTKDDIVKYAQTLQAQGYSVTSGADTTKDSFDLQLGKQSVDAGSVLLMEISYEFGNNAEITYRVGQGIITQNQ